MDVTIITILRTSYWKLASIAQKRNCGWISAEQAREFADEVFRDTAAEISRRIQSSFVTDN